MSTPAALPIPQLPEGIPRLHPNGSNWVIFSMRFCEAMRATCRWGYFDGTEPRPEAKDPANPTTPESEALHKWDYENLVARYFLSQCLPDTTAVCFSHYITARELWDKVDEEYTVKNIYAQIDLEQAFFKMRRAKGGDVPAFLKSLRDKHEELVAAGGRIADREYERTVLRVIPDELAKFASQILSSFRFINNTSIDTDVLINYICEEAERLKSRRMRSQGGNKKEGQTLAATGSEGGKKRCREGRCHNCGKPGHWARECRSPKKEEVVATSTAQGSSCTTPRPQNMPVGVVASDIEGDGFWIVEEEEVAQTPVVSAEPDPMLGGPEQCEETEANPLFETIGLAVAVINPVEKDNRPRVELHDSAL